MRYLAWICAAGLACAQGTDPKPKPEDYEAHAVSQGLGAEYMVYSVSGQGKTFIVHDHLVVDVALFPPKGKTVTASSGDFQLRVDGKTLRPVTPQMVIAAMQRKEWYPNRGVQATAGSGNDAVILGAPPRQLPPFGMPRRTPAPPRAPEAENRSGLPPAETVSADELIVSTALPEGEFKRPVSGYIFFPYTGKASKIRRVDLLYKDAVLSLK